MRAFKRFAQEFLIMLLGYQPGSDPFWVSKTFPVFLLPHQGVQALQIPSNAHQGPFTLDGV